MRIRGCLLIFIIGIVGIVAGIFFFQETSREIDVEMSGILYTLDSTVKEEITVQISGEETRGFMEAPRFRGELLISGEEVHYSRDLGLIEKREERYAAVYPEQTTEMGDIQASVTIDGDFEQVVGVLTLMDPEWGDEEVRYYFGAPGDSIEEVTEIEIAP